MSPETRLDLLADRILADAAPLSVGLAGTAAGIDAVLRLRYECVVELGWSRPEDHPDGRELDAYDDGATFVVCHDGPALVGTTRLVPPVPGRPLLAETEFGVTVDGPDRVVEAGRLVIPRAHRGAGSRRILSVLFARGWLATRELGFERIVGQVTPALRDLYRGLGLVVTVLGPGRTYFGEERLPVEVNGSSLLEAAPAGPASPLPFPGPSSDASP